MFAPHKLLNQQAQQRFHQRWRMWKQKVLNLIKSDPLIIRHYLYPAAHIRAVYTRENKLRITQSAASSHGLGHSYNNSVYKKLVLGLRRPRTSISCHLYEQFAAYISRRLCSLRLIFPRMNGPIVANTAPSPEVNMNDGLGCTLGEKRRKNHNRCTAHIFWAHLWIHFFFQENNNPQ